MLKGKEKEVLSFYVLLRDALAALTKETLKHRQLNTKTGVILEFVTEHLEGARHGYCDEPDEWKTFIDTHIRVFYQQCCELGHQDRADAIIFAGAELKVRFDALETTSIRTMPENVEHRATYSGLADRLATS